MLEQKKTVNTTELLHCPECAIALLPTEAFPKNLCVECYAMTPEANAPMTARQLSQMWGGK
jgi:protein-arginine kinase activator protein McsA